MSTFAVRMAVAKAAKHQGQSFRIGPYKVRKYPYGLAISVNGHFVVYNDEVAAIRDMATASGRLRNAMRNR